MVKAGRICGITYIRFPVELLSRRITSAHELVILALAVSFGENGLRMSNSALAELLYADTGNIQRVIRRLREKGYLRSDRDGGRRVLRATGVAMTPDPSVNVTPAGSVTMTPIQCHFDTDVVSHARRPSISKRTEETEGGEVGGPQFLPGGKEPSTDSRFEQFWSTYPRHQGRMKAFQAWQSLNPSDELTEHIIASVQQHKESEQWQKDGGQFIPAPAKYLQEQRWEDELVFGEPDFSVTPRMPTEEELAMIEGDA